MESPDFDRRAWPAGAVADRWLGRDGWPHRVIRLQPLQGVSPKGDLLFLGGRSDMIEKYLEPMDHWTRRGWSVVSFDWRGQGGSGRLLAESSAGHSRDFGIWVDDLAAFWADWNVGKQGRRVAVAHSMGGHLLLRAMVERKIMPDKAALVSPMLGLNTGMMPSAVGRIIANAASAIGLAEQAAWKSNIHSPSRQARLSHDADRIADELFWLERDPSLALGSPTWNWIAQAYRSTRNLEHHPDLDRMTVPTLLLATTTDRLVSPAAIRRVAGRLPHATLHFYGAEAAHEILREADGVRLDALARIDAFLDQAPA
jgi:lysophospholipase